MRQNNYFWRFKLSMSIHSQGHRAATVHTNTFVPPDFRKHASGSLEDELRFYTYLRDSVIAFNDPCMSSKSIFLCVVSKEYYEITRVLSNQTMGLESQSMSWTYCHPYLDLVQTHVPLTPLHRYDGGMSRQTNKHDYATNTFSPSYAVEKYYRKRHFISVRHFTF